MDPLLIGVALLLVGLFTLGTVRWFSARIPRRPRFVESSTSYDLGLEPSHHALIIVESGGRLAFADDRIRRWTGVDGGKPDLDQLSQILQPTELFLGLCSAEGQADLTLGDQKLEASSHRIPYGPVEGMVITLRPEGAPVPQVDDGAANVEKIEALIGLVEEIASHSSADATVEAFLGGIRALFPSTVAEFLLWDYDTTSLRPFKSESSTPQSGLDLEEPSHPRKIYADWIVTHNTPLQLPGHRLDMDGLPPIQHALKPYKSYLGLPVHIGSEFLGVLELTSLQTNAFQVGDKRILDFVASQIALSLKRGDDKRVVTPDSVDLSSVIELADDLIPLGTQDELVDSLSKGLARILEVEVLGFLIYEAASEQLVGKIPFYGLPSPFVESYFRLHSPPVSALDKLWRQGKPFLSNDVEHDGRLERLGFGPICQAASIRNALLVPLTSAGRKTGILFAGNKTSQRDFGEGDIRLSHTLATLSNTLLENAYLQDSSQWESFLNEHLLALGDHFTSSSTIGEIIKQSVHVLARMLKADHAALLYPDPFERRLRPHLPSLLGLDPETAEQSLSLQFEDPAYHLTASSTGIVRTTPLDRSPLDPAPLLSRLIERLGDRYFLEIPMITSGPVNGELILGRATGEPFMPRELELAVAVSRQIANLLHQLDSPQPSEESLRRQRDEVEALVRFTQELGPNLDRKRLASLIHKEAIRVSGASCASVLFLDKEFDPILAVGDAENEIELSSLEWETLQSNEWRIIDNFGELDAPAPHDDITSSLLLPITALGNHVGIIHLHGKQPHHFSETDAFFLDALATQAAAALQNIRHKEEVSDLGETFLKKSEALSEVFNLSISMEDEQTPENTLRTLAQRLQSASDFKGVAIYAYNPDSERLERVASSGEIEWNRTELQGDSLSWDLVEELFTETYLISQSYLVPSSQSPIKENSEESATLELSGEEGGHQLQFGDLLLTPLSGVDGRRLGLITIGQSDGVLPLDPENLDLVEIFAKRAALTLEQSEHTVKANARINNLTRQLMDLRAAHAELSSSTRDLLRQDTAKSYRLDTLEEQGKRFHAFARIIEKATAQSDETTILKTFADDIRHELQLASILIAQPKDNRLTISTTSGELPEGVSLESLMGQQNPLQTVYQEGSPLLINDVLSRKEWMDSPLVRSMNARSFLALPIHVGGPVTHVVLFLSDEIQSPFEFDDLETYSRLANQLGTALDHIRVLAGIEQRLAEGNLLLEFNRQLGSLDLRGVLDILADGLRRAMPAAETCMITVWQPDFGILIPYSASGYTDHDLAIRIALKPGEAHAGKVFESGNEINWTEIDFTSDLNFRRDNLEYFHLASGGRVPVSAFGMPLIADKEVVGAIILENYTTSAAFSESDIAFVRSLAGQAALTIQNAHLFQAAEERAQQLKILTSVSASLASNLDSDQIVAELLQEFSRVLPFDRSAVMLRDGHLLRVAACSGFKQTELRKGSTIEIDDSPLYQQVLANKEPVIIKNTSRDPRIPPGSESSSRTWLGIPMTAQEARIGLLIFERSNPVGYKPRHIEIASILARQASVAIENARLYEAARGSSQELEQRISARTDDLRREHDRAETLLRITSELSVSLDLDRVLDRALVLVNEVIGAEQGAILLVSPDSEKLIVRASFGSDELLPPGGRPTVFTEKDGLAGWVIQNRQAVIVPDLAKDDRWIPSDHGTSQEGSALVVPLMVSEDSIGTLMLLSREQKAFDSEQLRLVSAAASQVAAAINNAELYALVRDQAERLGSMLRSQQVEASKSRAILESIADGVIVTDASHKILLFNESAQRILRMKREDVLGRKAFDYIGVYGAAGRRWVEAVQGWSEDPLQAGEGTFLSERLILDDERVVSVHPAPVILGDEFLGTVSIFRDITREVEVDRLKSEFVATVSHELRTPMTSIKGYVEVLLMGAAGGLNDEQRRFLGIVKNNTERLEILVNDLLDVSRIESGRVDLSFEAIEVNELLSALTDHLSKRSEEEGKAINFTIVSPDDLSDIWGDPERIRQIFDNLVDNSFNYTPSGGKITLSAQEAGDEIEIEVADTGIGISMSEQERIFERFYRGEQALTMGVAGTGLGLSIVLNLVEMHGGRIWVTSEGIPGRGTTFTIALPTEPDGSSSNQEESL